MNRKVLFALVAIVGATVLHAQAQTTPKFGYTSLEYIVAFMPEAQVAQAELSDYEAQLQSNIEKTYQEFQQKLAVYQDPANSMIDAVRADKEQELQQLQARVQQLQQEAPQRLQNKQNELLGPIYQKAQEAINTTAKENGYTYIFEASSLLFAPEGDELSDLVFQQLGVEVPTAAATTSETPMVGEGH